MLEPLRWPQHPSLERMPATLSSLGAAGKSDNERNQVQFQGAAERVRRAAAPCSSLSPLRVSVICFIQPLKPHTVTPNRALHHTPPLFCKPGGGGAAPALPVSPGSTVINVLVLSPSQQAQPQAAPSGWSGAVTGVPVPLTGLPLYLPAPGLQLGPLMA